MGQRPLWKNKKYIIVDGELILVPLGAEGEGDPGDTDTEVDDTDDPEAESKDDDGDGDGEKLTPEEFEKLKRRMKAADQRASAAEAKIKLQEDAKKDELTRATDRIAELETELASARNLAQTQALENAFYASNDVSWHDPEDALSKIDREGIQDDEGNIDRKALKAAIASLSKSRPYLVKPEGEASKPGKNGSTGAQPGAKKSDPQVENRDALIAKYKL